MVDDAFAQGISDSQATPVEPVAVEDFDTAA